MTLTPLAMRRARLMELLDVSKGPGLEIGPLHAPVTEDVTDVAEVYYVDVFSRDELRAHYANDPNVDLGKIPEIHFVLSGPEGIRSLPEAVRPAAPFGWAVASHVVEHVPDIISWLAQLSEVLVDDGQLLLVVPDRRYTFDILRPCTTVGQMLQAHDLAETTPSVRAVYDMFRTTVTMTASDAWNGEIPGKDARITDLPATMRQVQRARDGEYVDCHVWMFTPTSFVEQIAELGLLGLCDLVVETVVPTGENEAEFFAVLRRLPRALTSEERAAARSAGVVELSDVNSGADQLKAEYVRLSSEIVALHAELEDYVAAAEQRSKELEDYRSAAEQRTKELDDERTRARALEDELVRAKASERWRVGGVLAVPASAVKRRLVR